MDWPSFCLTSNYTFHKFYTGSCKIYLFLFRNVLYNLFGKKLTKQWAISQDRCTQRHQMRSYWLSPRNYGVLWLCWWLNEKYYWFPLSASRWNRSSIPLSARSHHHLMSPRSWMITHWRELSKSCWFLGYNGNHFK